MWSCEKKVQLGDHTYTDSVYSTNLYGVLLVCQQAQTQNIAADGTSAQYVFGKDTNKA